LYQYKKYLTVKMNNNKNQIEGSEAAADDRLLYGQEKLDLVANIDGVDIGSGIKSAQNRRGQIKNTLQTN
jgi:hypothetical protein